MVVSSPERGEHTAFYPVFPLKESTAKAFGWLFLWNFKEKKHQPFSMAQPFKKAPLPSAFKRPFPIPRLSYAGSKLPPVMQDAGTFPIRREIRLHAPAKA
ncbi:hypothetical protein [uncultured Bilophila sp.]|uniref:hypothetical protein n=1 Tax=uncultured Bilophila sp. TaxID=529385 RepID=UPI00280AD76E|nr:hypothetical protein [uncultured Bilophila sp.]